MNKVAHVHVLACTKRDHNLYVIQIPKTDYKANKISSLARYAVIQGEYWIYVGSREPVPNGAQWLTVHSRYNRDKRFIEKWYTFDPPKMTKKVEEKKPDLIVTPLTTPCLPHDYHASVELRVLYCTKCGNVINLPGPAKPTNPFLYSTNPFLVSSPIF